MGSINFTDFLLDKLLSFSSKMKETSFKPGSALCLLSDSPSMYTQYAGELLDDLLVNGILASEYESHKPVHGTKIGSPFVKNLGPNNLEHCNLGFSPHLFNVVQDSIRFVIGQPEVKQFPSNGILSQVLCDPLLNYPFTMKNNYLHSKLESDVQPINETKLKMSISVKSSTMSEGSEVKNKLNSVNGFALNLELANRKTKEMNKRSKKRRRRQKKNRNTAKSTSAPPDVVDSFLTSPVSSRVPEKSSDESKFIVSVEHNIQGPSLVSSFVISVGSVSDEDSDWDFCSETDESEPTDFEFTGLFLANLSTPAPCLHPTQSPVAECNITAVFQDDEIARMQAVLIDVNKNWNESTKGIDMKPKCLPKVSFASDDKLVEVFLVEVYDRKGEWETKALERLRFRRRIEELEKVISPCLSANHRLEVYKKSVQPNL